MMTSFTRIIIVLGILRQAIGLQQSPSNQVLIGIALFMSFFIMSPVLDRINNEALQPYLAETIQAKEALEKAELPIHQFMLAQTRIKDLNTFMEIANAGGQARRRAAASADPGVCHQRAQDRVPDRFHAVSAVPGDRPGGGQYPDGDGDDDVVADAGLPCHSS